MAGKAPQVQEGFLFEALREKRPLELQMVSGGELRGTLERFDTYILVLRTERGPRLIYKASVAAIRPAGAGAG